MHWYPDEEPIELAEKLGEKYDLDPKMIFGCGSDELIVAICQAYLDPGDEAVHTEYGFIMYPMSTKVVGRLPYAATDNNFRVDIDSILDRISSRTRIVFLLQHPNNPTGSCYRVLK